MRKNNRLKLADKNKGKKRPAWKMVCRFITITALVIALLFLFINGEQFFRINEIRVEGTEATTAADILAVSGVKKGKSIFLLQEQIIADKIMNLYPRVEHVETSRHLPDAVVIEVTERTLAGYIVTDDGLWLIDRNAYCFAHATEPGLDYPYVLGVDDELIIPGTPLGCPFRKEALVNLFAAWPGGAELDLAEINLENRNNLIVYTDGGLEIWLGDGKDMTSKLDLIVSSIPYIDTDSGTHLDVRSGTRLIVSKNALITEKEVEP